MTPKEYLLQVCKLDLLISQRIKEKDSLKKYDSTTSLTAYFSRQDDNKQERPC